MTANHVDFRLRTLCRLLKVSPSGRSAWQGRPASRRSIDDAVLTECIRALPIASDEDFGSPNIHVEVARRAHG